MSIHPRRALAESEAAAWLDLHADWAQGLPAEVRDTSVIGTEPAPSGDGRSLPWYRIDGTFVGSPAPRGYEPLGLDGVDAPRRVTGDEPSRQSTYEGPISGAQSVPVDYASLDRERRLVHDVPAEVLVEFSTPALPLPAIELRDFAETHRQAVRCRAAEGTRQFSASTATIGQRVPSRLTYDQHTIDAHRYRTESYPDLDRMGVDVTWMQQLAYDELISWLRIEAGCTEREVEALERRAAGVAQPTRSDRETLARAMRRAQAAMA